MNILKFLETKNGCKIYQVLSGRSNVFLVINGEINILIDTSPERKWKKLRKKLTDLGIFHLDYLVLTHTHFDHAANASKIKSKYNPIVMVHQTEAGYLASGDNIIPMGTNFLTRNMIKLAAPIFAKRFKYEPCKPDILLDDSVFNFRNYGINAFVLHTPGHTPGSVSLVVDNEIAIVGDAMFGIFKNSVYPPFANNVPGLIRSWGSLLDTGCAIFLPAHGTSVTKKLLLKDYNKRTNSISDDFEPDTTKT